MLLNIQIEEVGGKSVAVIRHGHQSVTYNLGLNGAYTPVQLKKAGNPFKEFNVLLQETLPEHIHYTIFELYVEIKENIQRYEDKNNLKKLASSMVQILDFFDYAKCTEWLLNSGMNFPQGLMDEFVDAGDGQKTKVKTYTKVDYTHLAVMSLIVRSMTPIWGEFMSQAIGQYGVNKEDAAFRLVSKATLWLQPPYSRLLEWIKATTLGKIDLTSRVLESGFSSDIYDEWATAHTVVRVLALTPLNCTEPNTSIMNAVFNHINNMANPSMGGSSQFIKDKPPLTGSDGSDRGEQGSTVERFKIRHSVSSGQLGVMSHCVRDPHEVLDRLLPERCKTNSDFYHQRLDTNLAVSTPALTTTVIKKPQLLITKLLMSKRVLGHRCFDYLEQPLLVRSLIVTQTVLEAADHPYLAMLSTAVASPHTLVTPYSMASLSLDLKDQLDRLYMYTYTQSIKPQTVVKGTKQSPVVNVGLESINNLIFYLKANSWIATCDSSLYSKFESIIPGSTQIVEMSNDIRNLIALLVIDIATRKIFN